MKIENMSPKRKAKERKFWRNVVFVSLIPLIMSMVFGWAWTFLVSFLATSFFYIVYSYFVPDNKEYGSVPWEYFVD